jgi:hypothetical protein
MDWLGIGMCGDSVVKRIVETQYFAHKYFFLIGVKNASNFGNPERFAKEKDAKYRVSTRIS